MDRYSIEMLGLSEVTWNISGVKTLKTGHTIIYSGNTNATDTHDKGVGFVITKKEKQSILEWNPVSSRIITARFDTKFQKTTIIQVYSPTNNADEEEKEDFHNSLQTTVNSVPKRDILMIKGDLNAKVGKDRTGREREMRPNGIGEMNENGEIFADFCVVNSLVIDGTHFPHKNCHKVTWVSQNGVTENQIDHIAISQRWRSSLQDVPNKRGADIASNHHIIIAKIQLKLLPTKKAKTRRKKFNVDLFKDLEVVQDYHILLQNTFSVLENLHDDETSIN